MPKWIHRLSDKDSKHRTATCSSCGPVAIKKTGNGFRCYEAVYEYRRRHGVKIAYHEPNPGICSLCSNTVRVAYDHSHETGSFRGWLCMNCNTVLGLVHDDPDRLRQLANYLESN